LPQPAEPRALGSCTVIPVIPLFAFLLADHWLLPAAG
jgi:hypothetical protein